MPTSNFTAEITVNGPNGEQTESFQAASAEELGDQVNAFILRYVVYASADPTGGQSQG